MNEMEKLASGVRKFQLKCAQLEEELRAAHEQIEMHEKRARAEEILLEARDRNAPDKIRPRTIDDFLDKRAQLETSTQDKLEKIASVVEMYDNELDDISLSEENDGYHRGDFTEWLRNKAT